MTGAVTLASEIPFPPSVEDFFPPALFSIGGFGVTKAALLVWLGTALIMLFFLLGYRNPQLVPGRMQWMAESIYGFVRESLAKDMIGAEGLKFAPYLATLFCFILVNNVFGIIPFIQISPNSHIAFPMFMAVISWVLFVSVGIRRFGFLHYMKKTLVLPAPWFILPLLIPIEFLSTFIVRPFTLAVRLFANMFAGHIILLVFTLGGFVLLGVNAAYIPVAGFSWLLAIALTFLETLVAILQAFIFAILTSSYIQGALAEEH
jgi:F-type H+-transporting ATPase subunit a